MKITVGLPDELVQRAKKAALDANTTITDIITGALRDALSKRRRKARRKKIRSLPPGRAASSLVWT
jgi:hypothetical protein